MEYIFCLFLVAGVVAMVRVRSARKPVETVAFQPEAKPLDIGRFIGVGSLVSVSFARRQVVGRVTRISGRRVRMLALVNGHTQPVFRKVHQLRLARQ